VFCHNCPNACVEKTRTVGGNGKADAKVVIVAQNPASVDAASDTPITGEDGTLLSHFLNAAGLPWDEVYRVYAVQCETPGTRKPNKSEIDACRPRLIEEIRRINPKVIITLGEVPLQALYGIGQQDTYAQELQDWQGRIENSTDLWQAELAEWRALAPKDRKKQPRPLKPKAAHKPRKPKSERTAVKDVMGATLVQTDTGIPLVATYSPAYVRNGHWPHSELVISHFAKAWRVAEGIQPLGTLGTYKTIKTIEELRDLKAYMLAPEVKVIAYDTETTGLKWMYAELLSISFSTKAGEGFCVPVYYNADGMGGLQLWPEWLPENHGAEWWNILNDIFGSDKIKLGQNQIFDMRMIERDWSAPYVEAKSAMGWKINGKKRDTELVHHAVSESLPHNMTNILAMHTDMPFYEHGIKKYKKDMAKAPNEMMWAYSAADADGLFRLWENLYPITKLEGTNWVLNHITMPMLRVCRDMEERGFPINEEYFKRLSDFYRSEIEKAEEILWEQTKHVAPRNWKYNYAPALREVLFEKLGIKPAKKHRKVQSGRGCKDCKDGVCFKHLSTGKDALDDVIRENDGNVHPVLYTIKNLKFLTKRQSTYLDGSDGSKGFKRWIRPDGRVHSTQKISRVETGRLASEEPNDKNIPNYVHIHPRGWKCYDGNCKAYYDKATELGINTINAFHDIIEAPPGRGIMSADWAQLEIWVLAYRMWVEFGERVLLDILESGKDIHMWMARQMFPELDPDLDDKDWKNKHPELRRRAKAADFGVGYGLTASGMVLRSQGETGIEEAEEIIQRYKGIVPVDKYFESIEKSLIHKGYIENVFGRRRHMPHLKMLRRLRSTSYKIEQAYQAAVREAINFPIQSSGSDLHSYASAKVNADPALLGQGAYVIMSVHDSLTFEFDWKDEDYARKTAMIVKNKMEGIAFNMIKPDGTPLHWQVPVEVEWGQTWGTPTKKIDAHGNYGDAN
jgi:uracil-DNA glycosylase family 4